MEAIFPYLDRYLDDSWSPPELWHGECPEGGVDAYCAAYAHGCGWEVRAFPAEIREGFTQLYPKDFAIRNQKMVDAGPDMVLAFFWKDALNRGTKMTVDMAREAKIPVEEVWR